jgi:hypothetical protein
MKLNELEGFPELGNTIVIDGIEYVKKREPIFNYTAPDYITGEYLEAYDLGFSDAEKAHGITGGGNE